jgi:hypothetical protein
MGLKGFLVETHSANLKIHGMESGVFRLQFPCFFCRRRATRTVQIEPVPFAQAWQIHACYKHIENAKGELIKWRILGGPTEKARRVLKNIERSGAEKGKHGG